MSVHTNVRRWTQSTHVFSYTEVKWLSKGRSLARVFELREPLQRFLLEKQSPLAAHVSDTEWITKLAYVCDIFNLLSKLSLSLQGRMKTMFKSTETDSQSQSAVIGVMSEHWVFDMFQTLAEILKETERGPPLS